MWLKAKWRPGEDISFGATVTICTQAKVKFISFGLLDRVRICLRSTSGSCRRTAWRELVPAMADG